MTFSNCFLYKICYQPLTQCMGPMRLFCHHSAKREWENQQLRSCPIPQTWFRILLWVYRTPVYADTLSGYLCVWRQCSSMKRLLVWNKAGVLRHKTLSLPVDDYKNQLVTLPKTKKVGLEMIQEGYCSLLTLSRSGFWWWYKSAAATCHQGESYPRPYIPTMFWKDINPTI